VTVSPFAIEPVAIDAPAARRARRAPPRIAIVIAVVSVIALLVVSYVGSNVWASVRQNGLERRFDAAAERWAKMDPVAQSQVTYAHGDPVARLVIPSIGLDAIVAEGATTSVMRGAPGHLPASATPGENGVAIITANRFGFGSFFLRLDNLEPGDRIVAYSALGTTTYQVDTVEVVPSDQLDLGVDSAERVLVLFGSGRLWGGSDRIVVRALAVEDGTA
jgi:LPXTG-site transpeptidase (sortase) family protein